MVISRKPSELHDPRNHQRFRSAPIAAAVVMKRNSDLNQPLQKNLFRFGLTQPEFLPDFMGLKKLVRIEKRNATLELLACSHHVPARFTPKFPFAPASLPA